MGGVLPSREKPDPAEQELQREEAEKKEKSRQLMQQRLQILKRRRGGTVGEQADQDQTDLIGG